MRLLALLTGSMLAAITALGIGWGAISYLLSSLIFAIARAAYEQAGHLLGL